MIKIKEKDHYVKNHAVLVDTSTIKYLVIPYDCYSPGKGEMLIISKNDQQLKCHEHIKKVLLDFNPIKNQVVCVSTSGTYHIETLEETFSFEDLVVEKSIKEECQIISNMIANYESFKKSKISTKRGIILAGSPETGKTTTINSLVKKVIESGGTVFKLFQETNTTNTYSTSFNAVDFVFSMAKRYHPSLIILEDFDLICGSRNIQNQNSVTNSWLQLLEHKNNDTIVVASTNRIESLDDAAIRSGRIDKIYHFSYPTLPMKIKLVKIHQKNIIWKI